MSRRGGRRPRHSLHLPGTRWSRAQQRAVQQGLAPVIYGPGRYGVPSSTHGRWYDVVRSPLGGFTCTCPAGSFGQPCKHVAAVYLLGQRIIAPWHRESPWLEGAAERPKPDEGQQLW